MTTAPQALAGIPHRLSLVVPMFNEQDNVAPLLAWVHTALADYPQPWELVVVDDGSMDATLARLEAARRAYGDHVRIVAMRRNFGQSAAMQAGIDHARGEVIATLDGDLQNDPRDIPRLVNQLLGGDFDLVAGWRQNRKDGLWLRKIPSRLANRLIGWVTGVRLSDYGCSLKVFRGEVIRQVRIYGEMHRFIPAWLARVTSPRRITETPVTHHARAHGRSKYGIARTFRVLLDLLSVWFFMRFSARPGHFFGAVGLLTGALGTLCLGYLFLLKLGGADIGQRPLLLTGILLVVMSVQFLTTGVLSELLARTYYEAGRADGRAYSTKADQPSAENDGWHWRPAGAATEGQAGTEPAAAQVTRDA